jgi:GntR family transcriptional regulator
MVKYREIAKDLRHRILNKLYLPGAKLPQEKEMCRTYNVSRITIKKAVDELVNAGLVIKRRGAGTFVKSVNDDAVKELSMVQQFTGFTESNAGKSISSEIIRFEIVHPSVEVADKLQIDKDGFVYDIIRARYADKEPFVVEYTQMPLDIIPVLKRDVLLDSIYQYIQSGLKLKIQSAHRAIRAMCPNEIEQNYLKVDTSFPMLEVEQVAYLDDGRAFEHSISRHRSDKIIFKTLSIRA